MTQEIDRAYQFVFRGLLTEETLDRAGRTNRKMLAMADDEIANALSLDVLDDELVSAASEMAIVYTAIAAFEISVRKLVSRALLEVDGEDWWEKCVSEKIRKQAENRKADEERVRWHAQRGNDLINYTMLPNLIAIIRINQQKFEPYIHNVEWAASVFDVIERSRNVIMHSGRLGREDIARVGINIRDWIVQVGA